MTASAECCACCARAIGWVCRVWCAWASSWLSVSVDSSLLVALAEAGCSGVVVPMHTRLCCLLALAVESCGALYDMLYCFAHC